MQRESLRVDHDARQRFGSIFLPGSEGSAEVCPGSHGSIGSSSVYGLRFN